MNERLGMQAQAGALTRRLVAAAMLLLAISIGVTSHAALDAFERQIRPEIGREAAAIGRSIAAPIERGLSLGIPFSELGGVPEYLQDLLTGRPGIAYLIVTDTRGVKVHGVGPAVARFTPAPASAPDIAGAVRGEASVRETVAGYDTALPLRDGAGQLAGWLHVGMTREPLDVLVRDARWDVAIVLLVSMLLAAEILRFVVARSVSAPTALMAALVARLSAGEFSRTSAAATQDEAGRLVASANILARRLSDRWDRLNWLAQEVSATSVAAAARAGAALAQASRSLRFRADETAPGEALTTTMGARITLFLFAMAEQFSTSFIPLFGLELARGNASGVGAGFGPNLLAALPIATFFAVAALATPFGARFAARQGARRGILLGALPMAAGFVGCAFASTPFEFALARALCGAGYAVVAIACQSELARAAAAGHVARSLGGFTGAVMTGAVCGTAIGALLADRLGYAPTFLLSALLVVLAQLVAARCIGAEGPGQAHSQSRLIPQACQIIRSAPFTAMVVLVAIPAKLVLGGFVLYAAPLALRDFGFSQPAIGRVIMLYGLCMLPALALGAWFSDRARPGTILMVIASALTGGALMLPLGIEMTVALPVAVALVGALQGLAWAPMLALAPAPSAEHGAPPASILLAFLRVAECVGGVAGPMLAAYVITVGGTSAVMLTLGAISTLAALAYAASVGLRRGATAS